MSILETLISCGFDYRMRSFWLQVEGSIIYYCTRDTRETVFITLVMLLKLSSVIV